MKREKTRSMKRVSRNQTKVFRAAPIRKHRPQYENYTTRLPAPLNPPRRVAREADATPPRSRLRCARWTSIMYHRSRPRSAKHRRPWNRQIGSARRSKMDGQLARQVWEVVLRPKGKTVLGTKTIFKRKNGKGGRIEKYKCRFVAQGFRQKKISTTMSHHDPHHCRLA